MPGKINGNLVTLSRGVLFFLRLFPEIVQFRCNGCLRLGITFFERLAPAKPDQHPNDHDYNQ